MATNSLVPYSNPAGNNQTSATSKAAGTGSALTLPEVGSSTTGTTSTVASTSNPLVPATSTGTTSSTSTVPASTSSTSSGSQLTDIYGAVGSDITSYLNSISGTNSVVLQDYIKSLQPQMASAQAQTNAALGAGGVSANSSVAAIADASLNAQETASIASESASLTETGMQIEGNMLTGLASSAENWKNNQDMLPYEMMGAGMNAIASIV